MKRKEKEAVNGPFLKSLEGQSLKMGRSRPLFLFISSVQHVTSVDGVLGILTRGGRMEGTDKPTEPRQHPKDSLPNLLFPH